MPRRADARAKLLQPGARSGRPGRSADRRANDRRFAVLLGRPDARAAPSSSTCSLAMSLPVQRSPVIRFRFDQRVTARVVLARILWLQGFPDQAARIAQSSSRQTLGQPIMTSPCVSLCPEAACPIALLVGDLAAAERYVSDVARPFDRACAGALASLGPPLSGCARHQARGFRHRTAAAARRPEQTPRSQVRCLASRGS